MAPYLVVGGLMTAADPTCTGDCRITPANAVVAVGLAGAIGIGIDALLRSRHQVFLAPGQKSATRELRIAPFLDQRGGGVAVSLTYGAAGMPLRK